MLGTLSGGAVRGCGRLRFSLSAGPQASSGRRRARPQPALRTAPAIALLLALSAGPPPAAAQQPDTAAASMAAAYAKSEHRVPMRDGTLLHTVVYAPKDASRSYPFLMQRTPYSCAPYGPEGHRVMGSEYLRADGYIFVCQDVRGRYMSEGEWENMTPHVPGDAAPDESADTWDTIEWLLASVPNHNGRVGMWGISYPGFYTSAAIPEAHPALRASSPQAPIADFWFDDFHHRGAYTLAYFLATPVFSYGKERPSPTPWWPMVDPGTPDAYAFYMDLGPLSNAGRYYGEDAFFWRQLVEHPNYDAFWQARDILPHLEAADVDHAVMTVGGWFDAEDLYGPLQTYRAIERGSPGAYNTLVMGPWGHGDWSRNLDAQLLGDMWFGDDLSDFFQREVEAPFFRHFLHGDGAAPAFEALVYDTGRRAWQRFDAWPPRAATRTRLYLRDDELLSRAGPGTGEAEFTEYVSDPAEPVPHTPYIRSTFTPRQYMAEDQRFAERRPDVIEFVTEPLTEPLTLAGEILAHLEVSTTGTDADWVVKLIDVYPGDYPENEHTPPHVEWGGFQQMVRSEIIRGRFRNSFETPEPFAPGQVTTVELPLQDVFHTFRPGHRIMVQVQSTWFPLFDRNPQTFVPNIFRAVEADFVKATHRVWHERGRESWVEVQVLP